MLQAELWENFNKRGLIMNLKNWLFALIIAGSGVAGGSYIYNKGEVDTDMQTQNLGISEEDTNINLDDVDGFIDGIKNMAGQLKDGIKNIINEYIDKN